MPVYLLSLHDPAQREQLARLCYILARAIPGVAVAPALRIEADNNCLESVMLQIGAIRINTPEPAAKIEEVAAVEEVARVEKPVEKKERRHIAPTGICAQCDKPGVLTKSGICKPCAMRLSRDNKKQASGQPKPAAAPISGFSGPVVVVEEQRTTERFHINRHGPLRGKKLG